MAGNGNTIDLRDAARLIGPVAFQVMVKPVGASCNLGCRYCYFLEKMELYPKRETVMPENILEQVIREGIEAQDVPEVTFTWHGGEPLLAGLPFFRKAVSLQKRYSRGKKIINTIQTNGTLVNHEWAAFFRDNDFLVGLSLDGPEDVHDAFRRSQGSYGSFSRAMRGLECLRSRGVAFNTLSTVNARSEGRGEEIYAFLRSAGSRYLQFLPVSEPGDAAFNVSPEGFGSFLCDIFDRWVRHDVGETFVSQFDAALCCWCGLPPGTCVFARTCSDTLTVAHTGEVYCCDHFVDAAHRLGTLAERSFREMMASPVRAAFVTGKCDMLDDTCRKCPWLPACNGECPQHRSGGVNRLCRGYRMFFGHAATYLDRMRSLLVAGRAPAEIMNEINRRDKTDRQD